MRWKKPEPRPETYWKPWFAWHPVTLENSGEKVWLEWVWRHVESYGAYGGHIVSCRYRDDMHWAAANLDAKDWPKVHP